MKKRGISPIIATVLLITVVVILSVIVFLWARGFIDEKAEKFGGAIEQSCDNVEMEAGLFNCPFGSCDLDVINRGNVPIYGLDVKVRSTGEVLVHHIESSTVGVGESISISLTNQPDPVNLEIGDELNIVPILLGELSSSPSSANRVAHTCDDQFGYAITVAP